MRISGKRAPWALGLAAALLLASSAAAQPSSPAPNPWWRGYFAKSRPVALPDGRQLNLYCEGSGRVTVILESGLGDGAESWRTVQDQLAKATRVCAYDRAGYGRSSPGPAPRDIHAVTSDLEQLLNSARLRPPYLLVGHSFGGPIVRMFAARHLKEVVGLVLVEPAVENQNARFEAVAPGYTDLNNRQYGLAKPCANPDRVAAVTALCVRPPPDLPPEFLGNYMQGYGADRFATIIAENDASGRVNSAEIEAEPRSLNALPLIVLTRSDVTPPPGVAESRKGAMFAVWNQMHDEVAHLSSRGSNRVVPNSIHAIQISNPQVVIDAIEEILAEAGSRPRR